jgi:hypothetical protein
MKTIIRKLTTGFVLGISLCFATGPALAEVTDNLVLDPTLEQAVFSSPESAAQTMANAISNRDREKVALILGLTTNELLPLDNIRKETIEKFLDLYATSHLLEPAGKDQYLLAIGKDKWTFPIPIVRAPQGWYFDTAAGSERIRIRRIGRNELAAMQAVLAYYDAQLEYAAADRNGNGELEYAQKFISSANQKNGLYWETAAGDEPSPLGPLFARGTPEDAYHGYYYRILTTQGDQARGGAYSYLVDDRMTEGFALIAWPAEYGNTGVMSFMLNQNGIIYQQDLGPDTEEIALAMQGFNPNVGWVPVQEVHGPEK